MMSNWIAYPLFETLEEEEYDYHKKEISDVEIGGPWAAYSAKMLEDIARGSRSLKTAGR